MHFVQGCVHQMYFNETNLVSRNRSYSEYRLTESFTDCSLEPADHLNHNKRRYFHI